MPSRTHSPARTRERSPKHHRDDRSRYDRDRSERYRDDHRDSYRDESRDRRGSERDRHGHGSRRHRSPDSKRDLFSGDSRHDKHERLSRTGDHPAEDRKRYRDSSRDSHRNGRRDNGRSYARRSEDRSPLPKRSRRNSSSSLESRASRRDHTVHPSGQSTSRDETAPRPHRDDQTRKSRSDEQSETARIEQHRQDARERQLDQERELEETEQRLNATRPKRRNVEIEPEVEPLDNPEAERRRKQLARQARLKQKREDAAKAAAQSGDTTPRPVSATSTGPPVPIAQVSDDKAQTADVWKQQDAAITDAKTKSAVPPLSSGTKITDSSGKATSNSVNDKVSISLSSFTNGSTDKNAAASRLTSSARAASKSDLFDEPTATQIRRPRPPMLANETDALGDTPMGGSDETSAEPDNAVDPLDAFMSDLGSSKSTAEPVRKTAGITREPLDQVDGSESMEAVGDEDEWPTAAKEKKKEIVTVDHSKITYEPFRKSFYTEPQELQDMDEEAVKSLRFELDNIQVNGANVPKPVRKFAQFGLGAQTLDIVRKLGFEKPTSIQSQAMPTIMSGRDVIGIAKTGSGKTVAFLLPMFRHIKDQRPLENLEGPMSVIIAPTRELATQIHKECQPYLKALNLRAVCAYGGSELAGNIAALKRGAEIVVCTPGRMIDLMAANNGRVLNLRRVTYVVLDEADRMYDMGFEPQVTKVLASVRPDRQMVLFSATFSKQMETLARKALHKPVQIIVGGTNTVAAEITQLIEVRAEATKFTRTLELLGELLAADEGALALIFVERQGDADIMLSKLAKSGYPCVSVHGGREQADRDAFVDDFKKGRIPVMIATSVAARGLDVKQLRLVINYDVPNHLEDYVHRAGRTGRAGETGTAVTFITKEQAKFAGDLVKALKLSSQPIPQDLSDLAEEHIRRVRSGEATAAGRGFGGKGLEKIESQRDAERRQEKRAHGIVGDDDEEEVSSDLKKSDGTSVDPKIQVHSRDAAAADSSASIPAVSTPTTTAPTGGSELKFEFTIQRTEKPVPVTKPTDSKAARLAAAAAAINNRVGARGTGRPIDNKGPDAGEFHATLEINDFPQKCRWAVTNRSNVAKVLEMTQASITTKGQYYKPGDEPPVDGPPKMYVLIEGDTERQVDMATRELVRLMKSAAAQEAESSARMPASGRYNVL